uniref:Uncharacterized protein n=1 Tax=Anguilla anguilla TaxID=7936 RepID=A0A0E9WBF2_ANGAN
MRIYLKSFAGMLSKELCKIQPSMGKLCSVVFTQF